jgi:ABC-type transporter Mla subunit MlaD
MAASTPTQPAVQIELPQQEPDNQSSNRLERVIERLQKLLNRQGERLVKADEIIVRAQERIDELQKNGRDTSSLEAALAAFEDQLELARDTHQTAQDLLNGLDPTGDPEQVRDALEEVREAMREAREIMGQALRDLRQAAREFRQANRPK